MKNFVYGLTLLALAFNSQAEQLYKIDETLSTVGFATIKKQYIAESAVINHIQGMIDETGTLKATVPLAQINTGIPIRDERLNQLFFKTDAYPNAEVIAKVPAEVLTSDQYISRLSIPLSITLMGATKEITTSVNVIKTNDILSVSTSQPMIINALDFAIPEENLKKLAETVGNISISTSVPVSISIILSK